jgi:hypothetical protein
LPLAERAVQNSSHLLNPTVRERQVMFFSILPGLVAQRAHATKPTPGIATNQSREK